MNLRIDEHYQILKTEIAAHWKTAAAMTAVAVVVGKVYGKIAATGVILIVVSNYQIVGKQIRILTWTSLRKTLIAVVLLGNGYFTIINPQLLTSLAVALILIDNFQLSTVNDNLATQNQTLNDNNNKLKEATASLQALEAELLKLQGASARIETAEKKSTQIQGDLDETVSEEVKNLPSRLLAVSALLKQVIDSEELKQLVKKKNDLRTQIRAILKAIGEVTSQLQPITLEAKQVSVGLTTTFCKMEANSELASRQIILLQNLAQRLEGVVR